MDRAGRREGGEPDLQPLGGAAGAFLGAADADPAADVPVGHGRRRERSDRRRHAVRRVLGLKAGVGEFLGTASARVRLAAFGR